MTSDGLDCHSDQHCDLDGDKPCICHSRMEQLLAVPGNSVCCDCGAPDPRWTSTNLGITLCIECSGIHRSFGVHKSKVRARLKIQAMANHPFISPFTEVTGTSWFARGTLKMHQACHRTSASVLNSSDGTG